MHRRPRPHGSPRYLGIGPSESSRFRWLPSSEHLTFRRGSNPFRLFLFADLRGLFMMPSTLIPCTLICLPSTSTSDKTAAQTFSVGCVMSASLRTRAPAQLAVRSTQPQPVHRSLTMTSPAPTSPDLSISSLSLSRSTTALLRSSPSPSIPSRASTALQPLLRPTQRPTRSRLHPHLDLPAAPHTRSKGC